MDTTSLWQATAEATRYPRLEGAASTDVLVIGGGITGLTLALLLARQGRAVTVLEADALGSGSTGRSTGNLYETVSDGLESVEAAWDADAARQVVALGTANRNIALAVLVAVDSFQGTPIVGAVVANGLLLILLGLLHVAWWRWRAGSWAAP